MSDEPVIVRIYGETYPLKTGEDPEYVAGVAGYVDARMREVAASGKVLSTAKIAVLAALHIADELLRLRAQEKPAQFDERLQALADKLDRALGGKVPG